MLAFSLKVRNIFASFKTWATTQHSFYVYERGFMRFMNGVLVADLSAGVAILIAAVIDHYGGFESIYDHVDEEALFLWVVGTGALIGGWIYHVISSMQVRNALTLQAKNSFQDAIQTAVAFAMKEAYKDLAQHTFIHNPKLKSLYNACNSAATIATLGDLDYAYVKKAFATAIERARIVAGVPVETKAIDISVSPFGFRVMVFVDKKHVPNPRNTESDN